MKLTLKQAIELQKEAGKVVAGYGVSACFPLSLLLELEYGILEDFESCHDDLEVYELFFNKYVEEINFE